MKLRFKTRFYPTQSLHTLLDIVNMIQNISKLIQHRSFLSSKIPQSNSGKYCSSLFLVGSPKATKGLLGLCFSFFFPLLSWALRSWVPHKALPCSPRRLVWESGGVPRRDRDSSWQLLNCLSLNTWSHWLHMTYRGFQILFSASAKLLLQT